MHNVVDSSKLPGRKRKKERGEIDEFVGAFAVHATGCGRAYRSAAPGALPSPVGVEITGLVRKARAAVPMGVNLVYIGRSRGRLAIGAKRKTSVGGGMSDSPEHEK